MLDADDNTARARRAIEGAIAAVDAAITAPPTCGEGMSIRQLEKFRSTLWAILGDVERIANGEQPQPVSGVGHIIVDSWPFGLPLAGAILGAEQEYERLLKRLDPMNR